MNEEVFKLIFEIKSYSIKQRLLFLFDYSILGHLNFRISSVLFNSKIKILYLMYWPIWRILSNITGIEISGRTIIGKGLKIVHHGQIFLNENTKIGKNCIIYNGVTIGSKEYQGGLSPIIGDNVSIGTGAKILGNIQIGNNINIGASTVVTKNFDDNLIIGGVPAKIINKK